MQQVKQHINWHMIDWRTRRTTHMFLTPADCAELLKRNTHNRIMDLTKRTQYGVDMLENRWVWCGDNIRFDFDGVLLDGQKRLQAAIDSGITLETDVVFGLDPVVQKNIDNVQMRTTANQVYLAGIPNASSVSAIARLVLIHRRHGIEVFKDALKQPTPGELLAFIQADHRTVQHLQNATVASRLVAKLGFGTAHAGFCWALFDSISPSEAASFYDELAKGVGLSEDNPVFHLRERLLNNKSSTRGKLTMKYVQAITFKAWIAYVSGTPMRHLRWVQDGAKPEAFPHLEFGHHQRWW